MTKGICCNPACPSAAGALPIERYPGAGEYCPDCGELLEPLAEVAQPFNGLSPQQALERLERVEPPPLLQRRRRRSLRPFASASAMIALATMVTGGALHQAANGQSNGDALRVCRSSISQRLASDVVSAYRAASGWRTRSAELADGRPCDVRFSILWGDDARTAAVVAHDAIVVVVNPQNSLAQLTTQQLRGVLVGEIRDWSELGSGSGPIGVVVPEDGSDEAFIAAKEILNGAPLGSNVQRVASTADVVRTVAGTQGRRFIGIAAFSGAVPAKIVSLAPGSPPSPLSIAEGGYPLAVAVGVEAAGSSPPAEATDLVRYARSGVGQTIVMEDGLVPLKRY